jgi:hypothetical protein
MIPSRAGSTAREDGFAASLEIAADRHTPSALDEAPEEWYWRMRRCLTVYLVIGICTTDSRAEAESDVGSLAADATVYEDASGANGGGHSGVCVGNLFTTDSTRRSYVRYDLPSIPSGSTVTRVVLTLTQERVRTIGIGAPKAATLELRRVSSSWAEGSGTGAQAACGGGADLPGIDWASAPGVSAVVSGVEDLPSTNGASISFDTSLGGDLGLIHDVQAWVEDANSNHGWRFGVVEEATVDNARLLTPASLVVYWTPPDEVPSLSLPGLVLLVAMLWLAAHRRI